MIEELSELLNLLNVVRPISGEDDRWSWTVASRCKFLVNLSMQL